MKTLLKILVGFVVVAIALGGAYAQFAKPEDAIRYRKSVMFLIGQHFGRMGAMVKENTPYDKEVFTQKRTQLDPRLKRLKKGSYSGPTWQS